MIWAELIISASPEVLQIRVFDMWRDRTRTVVLQGTECAQRSFTVSTSPATTLTADKVLFARWETWTWEEECATFCPVLC